MNEVVAEFEIEGLPKMTNQIGPKHWRIKHLEANKWKILTHHQCAVHQICGLKLSSAKLFLTRFSTREPDFDGLVSGFKHVIDGLVSADVIINDKPSVIGQPNYAWEYAGKNKGKIKVKIERTK